MQALCIPLCYGFSEIAALLTNLSQAFCPSSEECVATSARCHFAYGDIGGSLCVRRNTLPTAFSCGAHPVGTKAEEGFFPFSLAGSPCPCRALQKGCATQAASPLCQTTPHRVLNRFRQRTQPPCRAHECRVLNPQSVNTAFCRPSCRAPPCRALREGIFLAKSK